MQLLRPRQPPILRPQHRTPRLVRPRLPSRVPRQLQPAAALLLPRAPRGVGEDVLLPLQQHCAIAQQVETLAEGGAELLEADAERLQALVYDLEKQLAETSKGKSRA